MESRAVWVFGFSLVSSLVALAGCAAPGSVTVDPDAGPRSRSKATEEDETDNGSTKKKKTSSTDDDDNDPDSGASGGGGDRPSHHLVFASSKTYPGSFGGLAKADKECAALAKAAGLGEGTWTAWMSGSATNANGRVPALSAGYHRIDGALATTDPGSGGVDQAINLDEKGDAVNSDDCVWTGTQFNGDSYGESSVCFNQSNWNDGTSAKSAATGRVGATNADWTDNATTPCNTKCRIYCFETETP